MSTELSRPPRGQIFVPKPVSTGKVTCFIISRRILSETHGEMGPFCVLLCKHDCKYARELHCVAVRLIQERFCVYVKLQRVNS